MLVHSWYSLLRVALSAAAVYALVIAALRITGAKALAKMSGYDLIVAVSLGSVVATIPLSTHNDGERSVMPRGATQDASALAGVEIPDHLPSGVS